MSASSRPRPLCGVQLESLDCNLEARGECRTWATAAGGRYAGPHVCDGVSLCSLSRAALSCESEGGVGLGLWAGVAEVASERGVLDPSECDLLRAYMSLPL